MSIKSAKIALVLLSLGATAIAARAEEPENLQAAMEANNAQWLEAYNTQDAATLGNMYAEDALLIAAGGQPIRGAKAIERTGRQTSGTMAITPGKSSRLAAGMISLIG
jgi:hypothetical protein